MVIPTPDYVRFATHYGFRPDFCHPADPESKGIVEHLVGYAKRDVPVPNGTDGEVDLVESRSAAWCDDVNAAVHAEICAVPVERLQVERPLLRCCRRCGHGSGGSRCAPSIGCRRCGWRRCVTRCRRCWSAAGSRPSQFDGQVHIYDGDGQLVAEDP